MAEIDLSKGYFRLPSGEYYTDDAVFAEEYSKIFSSQWLYAGHVSEFPKRGSFVTVDLAGESVIVVRGEGDAFHGHLNLCTHRGYTLCDTDRGTVRSFVCPYHQWRFDIDGSLKNVPNLRDGEFFDFKDFGLKTVHADSWNGMVFFYLGDDPPVLAETLNNFHETVSPYNPRRTRLAHVEVLDLDANWKTTAENFNECYHCAGTHQSFYRANDVPRMQLEATHWFDEQARGASTGGDTGMPLRDGYQTLSVDGSLVSTRLLGQMTGADAAVGRNAGINMLPNYFYAGFYVDHWWAQAIFPISTTKSRMSFKWYVHEDAVEGVDYDVDTLTKMMTTTYLEDIDLIERTYRGVTSRGYVPGPIVAKNEPLMHSYVQSYWTLMGRSPTGSPAN